MEIIVIKPHHLLDIFKLYGAGVTSFTPDTAYKHDFYRVANSVLSHPHAVVKLVSGLDDICVPCKFNSDGICIDTVPNMSVEYTSKEKWNKLLDTRILNHLGLKEGNEITVLEYCKLVVQKISENDVFSIWDQRPKEESQRRAHNLFTGIKKYLS